MSSNSKLIIFAAVAIIIGLIGFGFYAAYRGGKPAENQYAAGGSAPKLEGLEIKVLKEGSGRQALAEDAVTVNYAVFFKDGKELDRQSGYSFKFGSGNVSKGMDAGTLGMKIGEVRRLKVAPNFAYGERGIPGLVPPNATLIFEIELVDIASGQIPANDR